MAVRFYKELNEFSTAGFYNDNKAKRGKYYEVERIVSKRIRKRKVSWFKFYYRFIIYRYRALTVQPVQLFTIIYIPQIFNFKQNILLNGKVIVPYVAVGNQKTI